MRKLIILIFCFISAGVLNAQPDTLPFKQYSFNKSVDGLKFPEGPAFDYKNTLYFSNCYGRWIGRICGGIVDSFAIHPTAPFNYGKTNGMVYNKDGFLYACDFGNKAIVRFSKDGRCDTVACSYKGVKFSKPNDLAFDGKGRLYFTDTRSYDKNNPDGNVYQVDIKTGKVEIAIANMAYPNGIAFSADGKFLYVSESAKERIIRAKLDNNGLARQTEEFISLPGGDPDGIAFDVKGNLWAAHFGGGAIYKISPKGKILEKIKAPGKKPSNLEFTGKDMKTLYVTEDETNAVYFTRTSVAGRRLFSAP